MGETTFAHEELSTVRRGAIFEAELRTEGTQLSTRYTEDPEELFAASLLIGV
jgi:hypothetical protein